MASLEEELTSKIKRIDELHKRIKHFDRFQEKYKFFFDRLDEEMKVKEAATYRFTEDDFPEEVDTRVRNRERNEKE